MSILALDLGTTIGWAHGLVAGSNSGFVSFKPKRFEGGGMRFLRFQRWLNEHHVTSPIGEVVFEEVRAHLGVDAAHCYGGFLATLTTWCEANSIPYAGVPVQHIKKYATGKGNANKAAVITAVRKRWNKNVTDDNEADAIALLQFKLNDLGLVKAAPAERMYDVFG